MKKHLPAALLLVTCGVAMAQTRDPRVDELVKETTQLKKTVADQEERITQLEKAVKMLQAAMPPLPARIPVETPPWQRASSWAPIQSGMSEAQVVQLLGPPTSVQGAIDSRTLNYGPDAKSTTTLKGSITLVDDRVTAMVPPAF
jgi:hypothetical protein